MALFGFFSLILVMIYWVNQAVALFDQLISDGQSALVFLEFTALSLPNIVRLVLPLSAFVASVYVTNRMASESELVVVQATGYSPFRLARPYLVFGVIVAVLTAILTNLLVPVSTHRLENRTAEIAEDITARMLTEGQFLNPSTGTTFYIRDITTDGELLDVFLSDTSDPATHYTYTSNRAFIVRTDRGPQLVMQDGMAQTLRTDTNRLLVTTFQDFAYDIADESVLATTRNRGFKELTTLELLSPTDAIIAETGRDLGALVAAGHNRFSQALLGIVASLIGFAALVTGGFSRFGVWKQIVGATVLIILVNSIEAAGVSVVQSTPQNWPVIYLASTLGLVVVLILLGIAARPSLVRRRPAQGQST